jgi:hypothetical protein
MFSISFWQNQLVVGVLNNFKEPSSGLLATLPPLMRATS